MRLRGTVVLDERDGGTGADGQFPHQSVVRGGVAEHPAAAELQHGTYYVYWYWNCRCDPCTAANAAKGAALAAEKQQGWQSQRCRSG